MGPKNIFQPWIELVIKENVQDRELRSRILGKQKDNNLSWQLKMIQTDLAEMVRLTRLKISSKIKPNSDGAKMKELEKQIIHRESVMINFFGSRDALKIELEKIQQMDSYKHFMEVLISKSFEIYHND
jgi:hypothetical protein